MNIPETLTPEQRQQIRVFILEKLGWKMIQGESPSRDGHLIAFKPNGSTGFAPDLFASLDVCHEAEEHLSDILWANYFHRLQETGKASGVRATAPQRAVALYQTLGGVL